MAASSEKPASKLAAKLAGVHVAVLFMMTTISQLGKIEKFDCELYIHDVEKLEMDGDTILIPEHVQMKFDEIYNMKKLEDAKKKQDAQEQH